MKRLAFDLDIDEAELRPADYWDLMGGVGFGGHVFCSAGLSRINAFH